MSNDLSKVAELTKNQPFGLKTVDSDGKVTKILPDKNDMLIDVSKFETKPQTDPEPDDGTNTSGGVNIVPGSIYDGSISERYLLWQGETDPSKVSTIAFLSDVGAKLNRVGDGLQFRVHLLKTPVTVGVKSSPVNLDLNYDPQNNPKENVFTTTSPIPFSIPASKLSSGNKVVIDIDGIGENFEGVKNHLAPTITFTFNSDKTMSVDVTEGYDLDGAVEGNTGAFYTIVLDLVTSYSTQSAVTQLPSGMSLMSGDADGEIPLQFVNDDFSNISGLQVTFNPKLILDSIDPEGQDNILNHYYVKFDDLGLPFNQVLKIGKDDLYSGFHLDLDVTNLPKLKVYSVSDNTVLTYPLDYSPTSVRANSEIKLVNGKLLVDVHLDQKTTSDGDIRNKTYTLKVSSVSTY